MSETTHKSSLGQSSEECILGLEFLRRCVTVVDLTVFAGLIWGGSITSAEQERGSFSKAHS